MELIGRKDELAVLQQAMDSPEPEMVSVIGRRRVGKTFLVRSAFRGRIDFELSGIQHATTREHLRVFNNQIKKAFPGENISVPRDWLEAFFVLSELLDKRAKSDKIVVFFDEVPWLAGVKSGFLKGLSYFWNSWASERHIVVVLCGSSASWMIRKILRDKGGLHNRVTKRIRLKPFTLAQTEAYLHSRQIGYDRYNTLLIYMAMGGIPHYLKEIVGHRSAIQNINYICFSENGLLKDEFSNLYPALFDYADYHLAIIRALADRHYGMVRAEIVRAIPFNDSGRVSKVLEELETSGFISVYNPFGKKKKEKIYRLSDEYSLFYLRFIEKHPLDEDDIWNKLSQTQAFKTWCGYAFENICLKHIAQIKNALGISGIYATASSFVKTGTMLEPGLQVDLLIDRSDRVINLVEIKFYNTALTLQKEDADVFREKLRIFTTHTGTKKMVNWIMVSPFGLKHNTHSLGLIVQALDMNVLFE